MKTFNFCFFLLLSLNCFSQVSLSSFPNDYQLFQRNEQDSSLVAVAGTFNSDVVSSLTLKVLKDDILFYENTVSSLKAGNQSFSFNPKIKAGKFKYKFELTDNNHQDIKKSYTILSGDLFLFYGQSNALATTFIKDYIPSTDWFVSVLIPTDLNTMAYFWSPVYPGADYIKNEAGAFALEFALHLSETSNYPIGIIQGAIGAKNISELTEGLGGNSPGNNTTYDLMIRKLLMAKTKKDIKYVVFRQGEYDAESSRAVKYSENFKIFYQKLSSDLPSLKRLYNVQMTIMTEYFSYGSRNIELVRDFQRNSENIYPKIRAYSSLGIDKFDGLHFYNAGYKQSGQELARIVQHEIYLKKPNQNVFSPAIRQIYKSAGSRQVILKFDEGQELVFPTDTMVNGRLRKLKDDIFINGKNNIVQSISVDKNYVYLNVAQTDSLKTITYLPPDAAKDVYYEGVHLRNKLGMRAFSFARQNIFNSEITITQPDFSIETQNNISFKLKWTLQANTLLHVERSTDGINFTEIVTINADFYHDTQVQTATKYYYRIWVETPQGNSLKSSIKQVIIVCLPPITTSSSTSTSIIRKKQDAEIADALKNGSSAETLAKKYLGHRKTPTNVEGCRQ